MVQSGFIKSIESQKKENLLDDFKALTSNYNITMSELRGLINKYDDEDLNEEELAVFHELESYYNEKKQ